MDGQRALLGRSADDGGLPRDAGQGKWRSEEHTSELQSRPQLVCRLLLEKKKNEGRYGVEGRRQARLKTQKRGISTLTTPIAGAPAAYRPYLVGATAYPLLRDPKHYATRR